MDIQITFETLYELLRREKVRPELQSLDEKFFENLVSYLKEKQAIFESQKSKDSIFSQESERTQQELVSIRKMIKELYEKREQKIINLALSAVRTSQTSNLPDISAMLKEELSLFNSIKEKLAEQRHNVLLSILETKLPRISDKPKDIKSEKELTTKLIRFTQAVPKFVADDLNTYGPFMDEDIANLPENVASLLVSKSRAEEID